VGNNGHGVAWGGHVSDVGFLVLCGLGCGVLAAGGDRTDAVQGLLSAPILMALYALTRRFTDTSRPSARPPHPVAATVIVVALLAVTTAELAIGPTGPILAAWSTLSWNIASSAQRAIPVLDVQSIYSALTFAILPVVVLIALGWRARDLGFGPSRRGTWRTFALWCGIPVVAYAIAIALGHGSFGALAHRTFIDVFRNGFAEEILFRGIVLRLTAYAFGLSAGNVVQALAFGLWHLGADLRDVHGNVTLAAFDGVATQALFGYFQGLVTLRTGNVLVSGSVHALADAAQALS
jgi:membrane protease YdiL (CAAX protease family)